MDPMTRDEVYSVLDSEREYQISQSKSPERPDMVAKLSVGETLVAIDHLMAEARAAWYKSPHNNMDSVMHKLRKIAGLTVQAGEHFGMPKREGF